MAGRRVRHAVLAVCDLSMSILVVYAWYVVFSGRDISRILTASGLAFLKYYTVEANILAAAAGLLCVPGEIRGIFSPEEECPVWAAVVMYIGVVSVVLTFVIVLFVLGPMYGYHRVYVGSNRIMHLVIPAVAVFSFRLSGYWRRIPKRAAVWAVIPTLVYALVYLGNVLLHMARGRGAAGADFYGLAQWGPAYIAPVFLLFMAVNYLLARLMMAAPRSRRERGRW